MESACRGLRLLFGALCICWCASTSAYTIGLAPTTSTHPLNGQFSVDIVLTGLEAEGQILSTYDFTVGFDPLLLQFTTAHEGGALGGGSFFDFSPDLGSVNLFAFAALSDAELEAQQGDFLTLATLSFRGIGLGTTPLAFSELNALGGAQFLNITTNLLDLPHIVGGALATIVPNAVPEPGTVLLLALVLPLLAVKRRRR